MRPQLAGAPLLEHRCMLSASKLCRLSRAVPVTRRSHTCFAAGDQAQKDLPDVQRLAELSQIEVTPEEAEEWGPKIAEIVDWFGQLARVKTDSVEPTLQAAIEQEANVLRPDTVQEFENRESLMKEMPEMEGPYVKVPKVF